MLTEHLSRPSHRLPQPPFIDDDPVIGDDASLALYLLYELSYRGFDGVDEDWEWEPSLLAFRQHLERAFLTRVKQLVGALPATADVRDGLRSLVAAAGGPSLSAFMAEHGSKQQMREFAVHRSAYQLKEADPHSWLLPRLAGEPKAALVEIQADEYGNGVERDMHAELFAATMRALGLDDTYGKYVNVLPGITLSTCNLVSLFGLHRSLRGAAVGHLALFEMTSVIPMNRYSRALARFGLGPEARRFYDVHVVADAEHEVIALDRLAAGFVRQEPDQRGQVLFGAAAVLALEDLFSRHLLDAWAAGRSSLRAAHPSVRTAAA